LAAHLITKTFSASSEGYYGAVMDTERETCDTESYLEEDDNPVADREEDEEDRR